MGGYRRRIRAKRLLGILGFTNTKVCRNVLQLDGIRNCLIHFFTLSWSAQRISGSYSLWMLLLNLLCRESNAFWRRRLCCRSLIKIENRLNDLVNLGVTTFCLNCFLICWCIYSIWIWHNFSTETWLWFLNHLRSRWSDNLLERRFLDLAWCPYSHNFGWRITSLICLEYLLMVLLFLIHT